MDLFILFVASCFNFSNSYMFMSLLIILDFLVVWNISFELFNPLDFIGVCFGSSFSSLILLIWVFLFWLV